ncbi:unnamed protein product, partial [marine sediment metagenome]
MSQLNGRLRVIYETVASVGAGATEVLLRPGTRNTLWHILWAEGEQNDSDTICAWKWIDPDNPTGVQLYASIISA